MSVILQTNQSTPFCGLGTWTYTVPADGMYTVDCQATIPHEAGPVPNTGDTATIQSELEIVINLNSSPQLTTGGQSDNPTPTQPSLGARTSLKCAKDDTITVVLSSSAAVDNVPNAIKGIINLFLGE